MHDRREPLSRSLRSGHALLHDDPRRQRAPHRTPRSRALTGLLVLLAAIAGGCGARRDGRHAGARRRIGIVLVRLERQRRLRVLTDALP
jgi:hypothetical protein